MIELAKKPGTLVAIESVSNGFIVKIERELNLNSTRDGRTYICKNFMEAVSIAGQIFGCVKEGEAIIFS